MILHRRKPRWGFLFVVRIPGLPSDSFSFVFERVVLLEFVKFLGHKSSFVDTCLYRWRQNHQENAIRHDFHKRTNIFFSYRYSPFFVKGMGYSILWLLSFRCGYRLRDVWDACWGADLEGCTIRHLQWLALHWRLQCLFLQFHLPLRSRTFRPWSRD